MISSSAAKSASGARRSKREIIECSNVRIIEWERLASACPRGRGRYDALDFARLWRSLGVVHLMFKTTRFDSKNRRAASAARRAIFIGSFPHSAAMRCRTSRISSINAVSLMAALQLRVLNKSLVGDVEVAADPVGGGVRPGDVAGFNRVPDRGVGVEEGTGNGEQTSASKAVATARHLAGNNAHTRDNVSIALLLIFAVSISHFARAAQYPRPPKRRSGLPTACQKRAACTTSQWRSGILSACTKRALRAISKIPAKRSCV